MTKSTLATIGSVNVSGLQVCLLLSQGVCCFVWLLGRWSAPCGLITTLGAASLLHNHSQTTPARGRQGCCQIKMHPRPHFCLVPVSLLSFCYPCNQPHCYSLLTTIAPLRGSSDQGLTSIAENFRAEGAKYNFWPPFLAFFGTFPDPIFFF